MNLGQWYVSRGRIDRSTFWLKYFLPIFAVSIVAEIIDALIASGSDGSGVGVVTGIVALATIVPSVSSTVTRLHDTGRSAWWLLIGLVPLVGWIVLLVFYCLPGEAGSNSYGPAPSPSGSPVQDPAYPQA